jgi:hypothetical protein
MSETRWNFTINLSTTDGRIRVVHGENYLGTHYSDQELASQLTDDEAKAKALDYLQLLGRADIVEKFLSPSTVFHVIRAELKGTHDLHQKCDR